MKCCRSYAGKQLLLIGFSTKSEVFSSKLLLKCLKTVHYMSFICSLFCLLFFNVLIWLIWLVAAKNLNRVSEIWNSSILQPSQALWNLFQFMSTYECNCGKNYLLNVLIFTRLQNFLLIICMTDISKVQTTIILLNLILLVIKPY